MDVVYEGLMGSEDVCLEWLIVGVGEIWKGSVCYLWIFFLFVGGRNCFVGWEDRDFW